MDVILKLGFLGNPAAGVDIGRAQTLDSLPGVLPEFAPSREIIKMVHVPRRYRHFDYGDPHVAGARLLEQLLNGRREYSAALHRPGTKLGKGLRTGGFEKIKILHPAESIGGLMRHSNLTHGAAQLLHSGPDRSPFSKYRATAEGLKRNPIQRVESSIAPGNLGLFVVEHGPLAQQNHV